MKAGLKGSCFSVLVHGLAFAMLCFLGTQLQAPPVPLKLDLSILPGLVAPGDGGAPGPGGQGEEAAQSPTAVPEPPAPAEAEITLPPKPTRKKKVAKKKADKPVKPQEQKKASPASPTAPADSSTGATRGGPGQSDGKGISGPGTGPGGGLYSPGQLDGAFTTLRKSPPAYPAPARRRNIEGWVKVRFVVNQKGVPEQIRILAAQPQDIFEDSVKHAVSRWRFRPGVAHGQTVRVLIEQTIHFKLK